MSQQLTFSGYDTLRKDYQYLSQALRIRIGQQKLSSADQYVWIADNEPQNNQIEDQKLRILKKSVSLMQKLFSRVRLSNSYSTSIIYSFIKSMTVLSINFALFSTGYCSEMLADYTTVTKFDTKQTEKLGKFVEYNRNVCLMADGVERLIRKYSKSQLISVRDAMWYLNSNSIGDKMQYVFMQQAQAAYKSIEIILKLNDQQIQRLYEGQSGPQTYDKKIKKLSNDQIYYQKLTNISVKLTDLTKCIQDQIYTMQTKLHLTRLEKIPDFILSLNLVLRSQIEIMAQIQVDLSRLIDQLKQERNIRYRNRNLYSAYCLVAQFIAVQRMLQMNVSIWTLGFSPSMKISTQITTHMTAKSPAIYRIALEINYISFMYSNSKLYAPHPETKLDKYNLVRYTSNISMIDSLFKGIHEMSDEQMTVVLNTTQPLRAIAANLKGRGMDLWHTFQMIDNYYLRQRRIQGTDFDKIEKYQISSQYSAKLNEIVEKMVQNQLQKQDTVQSLQKMTKRAINQTSLAGSVAIAGQSINQTLQTVTSYIARAMKVNNIGRRLMGREIQTHLDKKIAQLKVEFKKDFGEEFQKALKNQRITLQGFSQYIQPSLIRFRDQVNSNYQQIKEQLQKFGLRFDQLAQKLEHVNQQINIMGEEMQNQFQLVRDQTANVQKNMQIMATGAMEVNANLALAQSYAMRNMMNQNMQLNKDLANEAITINANLHMAQNISMKQQFHYIQRLLEQMFQQHRRITGDPTSTLNQQQVRNFRNFKDLQNAVERQARINPTPQNLKKVQIFNAQFNQMYQQIVGNGMKIDQVYAKIGQIAKQSVQNTIKISNIERGVGQIQKNVGTLQQSFYQGQQDLLKAFQVNQTLLTTDVQTFMRNIYQKQSNVESCLTSMNQQLERQHDPNQRKMWMARLQGFATQLNAMKMLLSNTGHSNEDFFNKMNQKISTIGKSMQLLVQAIDIFQQNNVAQVQNLKGNLYLNLQNMGSTLLKRIQAMIRQGVTSTNTETRNLYLQLKQQFQSNSQVLVLLKQSIQKNDSARTLQFLGIKNLLQANNSIQSKQHQSLTEINKKLQTTYQGIQDKNVQNIELRALLISALTAMQQQMSHIGALSKLPIKELFEKFNELFQKNKAKIISLVKQNTSFRQGILSLQGYLQIGGTVIKQSWRSDMVSVIQELKIKLQSNNSRLIHNKMLLGQDNTALYKKKLEVLQEKFIDLQAEKKNLLNEIKKRDIQFKETSQKLDKITVKYNRLNDPSINSAQKDLRSQLNAKSNALAIMTNDLQGVQNELGRQKMKVQNHLATINNLKNQLNQLRQKYDNIEKQKYIYQKQSKPDSLKAVIEAKQKMIAQLEQQTITMHSNLQKMKFQLQEKQQTLEGQNWVLSKITAEHKQLITKARDYEQRISFLDSQRSQLREKVELLEANENSQKKIKQLKAKLADVEIMYVKLNGQYNDFKQQMKSHLNCKKTIQQNQKKTLKLMQNIKELQKNLLESSQTLKRQSLQKENLNSEIQFLTTSLNLAKEEISNIQQQRSEFQNRKQQEFIELQETISGLQSDIRQHRKRNQQILKIKNQLQDQLVKMREKNNQGNQTQKKLNDNINKLQALYLQTLKDLEKTKTQYLNFCSEKQEIQNKLTKLLQSSEELQKRNQILEQMDEIYIQFEQKRKKYVQLIQDQYMTLLMAGLKPQQKQLYQKIIREAYSERLEFLQKLLTEPIKRLKNINQGKIVIETEIIDLKKKIFEEQKKNTDLKLQNETLLQENSIINKKISNYDKLVEEKNKLEQEILQLRLNQDMLKNQLNTSGVSYASIQSAKNKLQRNIKMNNRFTRIYNQLMAEINQDLYLRQLKIVQIEEKEDLTKEDEEFIDKLQKQIAIFKSALVQLNKQKMKNGKMLKIENNQQVQPKRRRKMQIDPQIQKMTNIFIMPSPPPPPPPPPPPAPASFGENNRRIPSQQMPEKKKIKNNSGDPNPDPEPSDSEGDGGNQNVNKNKQIAQNRPIIQALIVMLGSFINQNMQILQFLNETIQSWEKYQNLEQGDFQLLGKITQIFQSMEKAIETTFISILHEGGKTIHQVAKLHSNFRAKWGNFMNDQKQKYGNYINYRKKKNVMPVKKFLDQINY